MSIETQNAAERNAIRKSGLEERVKLIKDSISPSRIRLQTVREKPGAPDKPNQMWGLVTVEGLPFYFQANKGMTREMEFQGATTWWAYAPSQPGKFSPPINSGAIEPEDTDYVLKTLNVKQKDITQARKRGHIADLFNSTVEKHRKEYDAFRQRYQQDPELRAAYGAAISGTCNDAEPRLILRRSH
jgi:hypothetical protein